VRARLRAPAPRLAPVLLVAALALGPAAVGASAQSGAARAPAAAPAAPVAWEVGPRAGYDWHAKAAGLGVELRVPLVPGLYVVPSGDYYRHAGAGIWQANLDLSVRLGFYGALLGGAGFAVTHRGDAAGGTRTGLDVFVELTPPRLRPRRLWPFAQARWLLVANRSFLQLQAGVDVAL
jgi:hypothetical protein